MSDDFDDEPDEPEYSKSEENEIFQASLAFSRNYAKWVIAHGEPKPRKPARKHEKKPFRRPAASWWD